MTRPRINPALRRDQPVNLLLTHAELQALNRVKTELATSRGGAARYLMRLGLGIHNSPSTGSNDNDRSDHA